MEDKQSLTASGRAFFEQIANLSERLPPALKRLERISEVSGLPVPLPLQRYAESLQQFNAYDWPQVLLCACLMSDDAVHCEDFAQLSAPPS